jgi:hypothetical protein
MSMLQVSHLLTESIWQKGSSERLILPILLLDPVTIAIFWSFCSMVTNLLTRNTIHHNEGCGIYTDQKKVQKVNIVQDNLGNIRI